MTEKQRREAFHDQSNWYDSLRFPQNDAFRVKVMEFYGQYFYNLQMKSLVHWDYEKNKPCHRVEWTNKFYFIEQKEADGIVYYEPVSVTAIYQLLKEAEQKETA